MLLLLLFHMIWFFSYAYQRGGGVVQGGGTFCVNFLWCFLNILLLQLLVAKCYWKNLLPTTTSLFPIYIYASIFSWFQVMRVRIARQMRLILNHQVRFLHIVCNNWTMWPCCWDKMTCIYDITTMIILPLSLLPGQATEAMFDITPSKYWTVVFDIFCIILDLTSCFNDA